MGIKGLIKFISDAAPRSLKEHEKYDFLMGQKLAIDASMSLYQFMIAIRDGSSGNNPNFSYANLTNESGETTSHIMGMLNRVVKFLEAGIKPVYVFDGAPPRLKSGELLMRSDKRAKAEEDLEAAKEAGDKEEVKKFTGRTVKVTKQHNDDVKHLLKLMGIPIVDAPCEAEAQCAKLAAKGKVYATATDDADALTFGSPTVIRHLNFSEQKDRGNKVHVLTLATVLEDLKLTMDEFIDFCILCGCDYCDSIKGIGPVTAHKLVQQHHSIENIIKHMKKEKGDKFVLPDNFPFEEARNMFKDPQVAEGDELGEFKWADPQYEELKTWLVETHTFNAERVDKIIQRLKKAKSKSGQMRLENFFGAVTVTANPKKEAKELKQRQEAKAKAKQIAKDKAAKRKAAQGTGAAAPKKKAKTDKAEAAAKQDDQQPSHDGDDEPSHGPDDE
ncbi:unnamed protein product [Vitrella brassicaformis CCMP3155]|uniref:Flap endonuclease 1 n=2 Tax=Vitrella brassicaformis TaxID=1169539 RepID=A0A0G4GLJ3_VITBC|nr:unnamed protein product [Vitrella brassicaformis CCMP3155]|mmetsp:Transcript_5345/g.12589  ORF Transcript_5345/g.12589 Transcript_5345/m.12589 type:complete len:444 (+) Transcript_5345:114-1445(+)|eukprot:CEM31007.1 unnamed protein product [Vitrella brassicaformis CCMP3155]